MSYTYFMSYPHIISHYAYQSAMVFPLSETARLRWLCLGTHDAIPRHEAALEPGRHRFKGSVVVDRGMFLKKT